MQIDLQFIYHSGSNIETRIKLTVDHRIVIHWIENNHLTSTIKTLNKLEQKHLLNILLYGKTF